jgi:hypothetical protein
MLLQRLKTTMKPTDEKTEDKFGRRPESKRAVMPLGALMSWLEGTHHREIMLKACATNFGALCKNLEQSDTSVAARIGLEVHHHPRRLTDISIFGGKELLRLQGVVYPRFAREWGKYLEEPGAVEHFPPHLIAEFDHKENGYEMMGFFQACSKQQGGIEAVVNAIRAFAETSIIKQESWQPKELQSQAEGMLRQTIEQLASPDYIGFVDRGKCAVKLIISISQEDLPKATTYLRHQYSAILPREMQGAGGLERFLRTLLNSHELVRTSIELDLTANKPNDKLAFECFPSRRSKSGSPQAPTDHAEEDSSSWSSNLLEERFKGYKESMALASRLPYGQKRPAANLVDDEMLSLRHTHRKFTLATNSLTVKDYILLKASPLPVNPEADAHSRS